MKKNSKAKIEYRLIVHTESIDYIQHTSEGEMQWEGTIDVPEGLFDFTFERNWAASYGGSAVAIISPKPDKMSKEEWNQLKVRLEQEIDTDFEANRKKWENVKR